MQNLREKSTFHQYRSKYQPRVPTVLKEAVLEGVYSAADVPKEVIPIFPKIV